MAGGSGGALRSFPPIHGRHASTLILGSMPGAASLQAREYYAHPRNAFWTIMDSVLGIERAAPYSERTRALAAAGICLWDVLQACRRSGSLDSAIERDSIVPNNFRRFLDENPGIDRIFFNGNAARQLFERHVVSTLAANQQLIARFTLPSTSPANAGRSLQEKMRAWRAIQTL